MREGFIFRILSIDMKNISGIIFILISLTGRKGKKMTDNTVLNCNSICPCDEKCPIEQALSMIGGKWKMRIICSLSVDGTLRYNDLKQKASGITPGMLSSSLKELEADGLVIRRQYAEVPVRVEYSLTEYGRELFPILHRLAHWAKHEPFDED